MEKFSQQLDFLRRTVVLARSIGSSVSRASPRGLMALAVLGRSTIALESVCVLFEAGLELDARTVSRTIAELAIDLHWMLKVPGDERIVQYAEFSVLISHRREASISILEGPEPRLHGSNSAKALAAASAGQTLEEFDATRQAEFERVKGNYRNEISWTPTNLRDRAKAVDLEVIYETVYRTGCDSAHSGPATFETIMKEGPEGGYEITDGSSVPKSDLALFGAEWAFLEVLGACVEVLAPERMPELKALASEFASPSSPFTK